MPSIRDVARTAGVSIATVSRVINGAETVAPALRKKVLHAVDACDYTPSVGRRSLDSIGLIYAYSGPFAVGSPYESACFEGMVESMRETPHDLCVVDIARDKASGESMRQFFARKGLRGAVVRSTSNERAMIADWARDGASLVLLGDHFDCPGLSFVYAESKRASREAVEHLVSLGHQRIAFAACDRDDGDHLDRLHAYQEVVQEQGIADETLVWRVPPQRLDGAQLLRSLLGRPNRPTAIFIADPLVAIGATNEAHRLGVRIPEDLSIVGFDDTDSRTTVFPRMSAVCQDSVQLGRAAVECVAQMVGDSDGSDARSRSFAAWLEINNSTGPPPESPERVLPSGARLPS